MADIAAFFGRSLDIADKAGIAREKIVLDPGIGFGKTPEQSMRREISMRCSTMRETSRCGERASRI